MRYLAVALLFTALVGYVSSQAICQGLLECGTETARRIREAGDDQQRLCSAARDGIACLERLDCPGIDDQIQNARQQLDAQGCSSAGFISLSIVSILAGIFIALFV